MRFALLRAVNVGGRKLPMAELRALCGELGWEDVETYIQSGNLVFDAEAGRPTLEAALEEAIKDRFGMTFRSSFEARASGRRSPKPILFPRPRATSRTAPAARVEAAAGGDAAEKR